MSDKPIIEVEGLWKRYGLPPFLPWRRHKVADHEWALRDISFSVPRGGSLGILGRNGAGKSTLLKLLAGVTPPDKGKLEIRGKIFPMIELTAGMSMELSGRENIRILGTIMGLSGREISAITPKVDEFSELAEWLYKPVWQYSSGMIGRLAFAIAVNMRADILLVDEVLSTGDIMFQRKCFDKVYQMLSDGTTLVFITHSPAATTRVCENGMLLNQGQCVFQGAASETLLRYYDLLGLSNAQTETKMLPEHLRPGTGDVRVKNIKLINRQGEEVQKPKTGEDLGVCIDYHVYNAVQAYNFVIHIRSHTGERLVLLHALIHEKPEWLMPGDGRVICFIKNLPLIGRGLTMTLKVKGNVGLDTLEDVIVFDMEQSADQLSQNQGTSVIHCDAEWSF